MTPGSKIVINELVMPDPDTVSGDVEARLRHMDLSMLAIGNSGERELGDWKRIFEQADKRFVFRGVSQPLGSHYSLLEAEWMGEMRSRL